MPRSKGVVGIMLPFDAEQLERIEWLASQQLPILEIAWQMGVSRNQFIDQRNEQEEITQALEKGYAKGRTALRAKQFQVALQGNASMLIHLGIFVMGQLSIQDKRTENLLSYHRSTGHCVNGYGNGYGSGIDPESGELSEPCKHLLGQLALHILRQAEEQEQRAKATQFSDRIAFDDQAINRC
jgi:hypothetical protein